MSQKDESRKRGVETTRKRYGEDHYRRIGKLGGPFKDPEKARLAVMKRWHPERFDANGNLIEEKANVNNS